MINVDELTVRQAANRDAENVRDLVFGVLAEYGLSPDPEGIDSDLDDIEFHYIERGGLFDLIEDSSGSLLGTVGLFPLDPETIELRKMYFLPELRGLGLGKKTLERVVREARERGFKKITLETASVLKEAIGLYESYGFRILDESHTDRCDRSYFLEL